MQPAAFPPPKYKTCQITALIEDVVIGTIILVFLLKKDKMSRTFSIFHLKKDKMGRTFSTYAAGEQCIQNFGGDI